MNQTAYTKYTNQSAFDAALAHLRKQGEAASIDDSCRYRAEGFDGKKLMCAVGCMIPDELYLPGYENVTAKQLLADENYVFDLNYPARGLEFDTAAKKLRPALIDMFAQVHEDLLAELQDAHDKDLLCDGIPAWEKRMEWIATRFNLTYTAPGA